MSQNSRIDRPRAECPCRRARVRIQSVVDGCSLDSWVFDSTITCPRRRTLTGGRMRSRCSVLFVVAVTAVASVLAGTAGSAGKKPKRQLVEVEQTKVIYLPTQVGGNYHTVLVLLRNTSRKVALDVTGQISILGSDGKLLKSIN